MFRNILVVNELGLGNAVLSLPFLDALANRVCNGTMWHIENRLLNSSELATRFRLRSVPGRWLRAQDADHVAILQFIECERIELFVNLRNEDFNLPINVAYAPLRARLRKRGLAVWDLFDCTDEVRHRYIAEQWLRMFAQYGVDVDTSVSKAILELIASASWVEAMGERPLGILLGASRSDKRVATSVVCQVIQSLVKRDASVCVVSGVSSDEADDAQRLRNALDDPSITFIAPPNVSALVRTIGSLRAVCCNDTFAMHCSVALGIPTVALFSTTRRAVWGPPDSALFRGISSSVCAVCPRMPNQGYCAASSCCAGVPNEAFSARDVVDQLLRFGFPFRAA